MYNNKGLTLIEVMIVIAIITILASLAAPSFSNILRRQQVSGEADVLFSLVYLVQKNYFMLKMSLTKKIS